MSGAEAVHGRAILERFASYGELPTTEAREDPTYTESDLDLRVESGQMHP